VEWSLDGGFGRAVFVDDRDDGGMEPGQPVREIEPRRESDFATSDQPWRIGASRDDGPAGAPGTGVDPQDPAAVRQDASSDTESSSKERLA